VAQLAGAVRAFGQGAPGSHRGPSAITDGQQQREAMQTRPVDIAERGPQQVRRARVAGNGR
jgi:hypothetical protein